MISGCPFLLEPLSGAVFGGAVGGVVVVVLFLISILVAVLIWTRKQKKQK